VQSQSAIRIVAVVLAIVWTGRGVPCQSVTRPENERRIASLPEDQQAFERFRFWTSALSQSELQPAGLAPEGAQAALLTKYAAWLAEGGFSREEVAKQIALLKKRGPTADAEFWNKYLVSERREWVNMVPNAFLVEMVKGKKPGKALDVSMGQGRNTIWLAQQGWDTTGFDPADQAVAEARATALRLGLTIHTEITTSQQFDFGENRWDLVVLSYAGCSQLARQVQSALKPGGLLVEEAFHTDALKTMKIGGSLCGPGELPHAFQELRVLRYEEPIAKPDFAPRPARVVRFAAEKPVE